MYRDDSRVQWGLKEVQTLYQEACCCSWSIITDWDTLCVTALPSTNGPLSALTNQLWEMKPLSDDTSISSA